MNATGRPNPLLVAAAAACFLESVPLLFAPVELLRALGAGPARLEPLLAQLLAAALFGLAMLNWMSRHSPTAGIHGRPLVVANLAHSFTAAAALARFAADGAREPALLLLLGVHAALAGAFARTLLARRRAPATVEATFAGE
jgi:hypothetical protein